MADLIKYLASLAGIGTVFLAIFHTIHKLGKKDKIIEINNKNFKIQNDFIKKYRTTKKKINNLSDSDLDNLLQK